MSIEKIALLVDSGTDVPKEIMQLPFVFIAPLNIHYPNETFQDTKNITPQAVYQRMPDEIPTTSTPTGEQISLILSQIEAKGYNQVIVITISSGLSGTLNAIRIQSEEFGDLEFAFIDTKNISVASGLSVMYAADLINQGESFAEVVAKTRGQLTNNKIFFYVDTLKYLLKGGRIGRVSGVVGQLLSIKPIISCDDEGIYYSVAKERGKQKALKRLLQLVKDFAQDHEVIIIIVNADTQELSDKLQHVLQESGLKIRQMLQSEVSPALGVHTGAGAIGIAVARNLAN
ncbi:MAG: DegV family protein [Streptococcaceae bacterium]|nr:DegV family protein [Streptococcaceae bacterium]